MIDRLAWIAESDIGKANADFLREDLTVTDKDGERTLCLYEDCDGFIGVPRGFYAEKMYSGNTDEFDFVSPEAPIPDFQGTFRFGQEDGFFETLEHLTGARHLHTGILKAACGSGKTCAALAVAASLKRKTLILVHKADLMEQWQEEIRKFLGIEAGIVRQDEFTDAPIMIAMMQTLHSRADDFRKTGFFHKFGFVIQDEVHHVAADTFENIMRQFTAKYRLGLTATPRRNDGMDEVIFAHLGGIATEMITERCTGTYIQIPWESVVIEDMLYSWGTTQVNYAKLLNALMEDAARNRFVVGEILKAYSAGRNVLMLTKRRAHVDFLAECLSRDCDDVKIFYGGMGKDDFREAQESRVVVSTFQMVSEGTDIPSMDALFPVLPVSDIEQTVGRIQRVLSGKLEPLIVDVVDNLGVCLRMAAKRCRTYERLGFESQ